MAQDDTAVEFFHGPAVFHEPHREPVEQLGMGGKLALITKVLLGFHETPAKEGGPGAVHHHPGGEWLITADQPAGEAQAVRRGAGRQGVQHAEHAGFHPVHRLGELSAVMEESGAGILRGPLLHDQRGEGGRGLAELVDFLAGSGQFGSLEQELLLQGGPLGRLQRDGQERLQIRGQGAGADLSCLGGEGDPEFPQRTGVMPPKHHGQGDRALGRVQGFFENEDCFVTPALAIGTAPAGFRIAVDGQLGADRLPELVLRITLRGLGQLHRLATAGKLEFTEEKIAFGAFVIGHPGAPAGQAGIGQGFEPDGGDPRRHFGELELIGVGFAGVAADKNGGIGLDREQGQIGSGHGRGQRLPGRRMLALVGQPGIGSLFQG